MNEHSGRTVTVDGVELRQGSRVRLRPGRNADVLDLALTGRTPKWTPWRRTWRAAPRRRDAGGRRRPRPRARVCRAPVLLHARGGGPPVDRGSAGAAAS